MKNLKNSVIAAAMVSLAFVSFSSCQKEDVVSLKQPSNTLSVKVVNPSTKTTYTYTDNGSSIDVNWALNDQLVLYKNDSKTGADKVVFTLQEAYANQPEGVFSIADAAQQPAKGAIPTEKQYNWDSEYIAYYPSTAQSKNVTAESFLAQFYQQEQRGNDNMAHLANYDLMKATKAAADDELAFTHQVAVLKMVVQVPSSTGDANSASTDYSKDYSVVSMTIRGLWGASGYQLTFPQGTKAIDYPKNGSTYKVIVGYITVPAANASNGSALEVDMMMQKAGTGSNGQSLTFKSKHDYSSAVSYAAGKVYICEVGMSDPYSVTEYVDLGLPSGTLWAKTNLGQDKNNPEGHYFQWGEVNGFKYGKNIRMVFDPATKNYDEVTETIGDNSCALNSADYQTLRGLGFKDSKFTIDGTVNGWYADYCLVSGKYSKNDNTRYYFDASSSSYKELYYNDGKWYKTRNWEWNGLSSGYRYYDECTEIYKKMNDTAISEEYTAPDYQGVLATYNGKIVGDAATYQLGEAWHMPAAWQIAELLRYTTRTEVDKKVIFTSKVPGFTGVSMEISNSTGWEDGWTQAKTGECRFQTTTAAKEGDNKNFSRDGSEEYYCWEFHYVTSNSEGKQIGLHSHHTRSTAVPIRPVAVMQASR